MKSRATLLIFTSLMFIIIVVTTRFNYERMKMDSGFASSRVGKLINQQEEIETGPEVVNLVRPSTLENLPRGIVESTSDLELKELWNRKYVFQILCALVSMEREWVVLNTCMDQFIENQGGSATKYNALLAVPVGLKQKNNVDIMVKKFLSANCSIILFHYDGNVDAWNDLVWSHKVVHVLAHNQTKWWFAKRFLHPDVVSIYDYIFLWDEDLGLEYFHPERYLQIVISEGLEISQPALDPDLSEVHHRITMRKRARKVHRRVYVSGGSKNCSDESTGPPCTGWVEGMAPVFSKAAWHCVWHLIQNDLIHGWGLDMKLGYCAQGDRTEKVGIVDSEYIIHQGIQTLGGPSEKLLNARSLDLRTQIRRQSSAELHEFRQRWDQAVREDEDWTDPFGT